MAKKKAPATGTEKALQTSLKRKQAKKQSIVVI